MLPDRPIASEPTRDRLEPKESVPMAAPPGATVAPDAAVAAPLTLPLPASVWAEARAKPPVTPDTSSTEPAATEIVPLEAMLLAAAERASVPDDTVVLPV